MTDRPETLRAAACQLACGPDPDENLGHALEILDLAASRGARLAVLPEALDFMGRPEEIARVSRPLDDPFSASIAAKAAQHEMWVVAGSVHEARPDGRVGNTSQVFDPTGRAVSTYRKTHLFDVDLPDGFSYRESDDVVAGAGLTVTDVDGLSLGTAICYDLRFPELFRLYALQGADVIALPAAFTFTTGAAHWEVLIRARAIENQNFVVAAGQIGPYEPDGRSYGHSMIVDPWGTVLATAPDAPGTVAVADLDLALLDSVRRRVPSLANRRTDLYTVELRA